MNAGGLAFGFFGLNLLWWLPGLVSLVGLLTFLPLVVLQRRINQLHAEMGHDPAEGSSFTLGTAAGLAAGALW